MPTTGALIRVGVTMINCDECGMNPANVHLTQIMQNETQVFHLCEDCARKKGISISVNQESAPEEMQEAGEEDRVCSNCALKLSEFRLKGWLGCPSCYDAFQDQIDRLLVQVHGSSVHKGKKYVCTVEECHKGDLERLRHDLKTAIKDELFEQAAAIRDVIYSLKQDSK